VADEPDNLVLEILRSMRGDIQKLDAKIGAVHTGLDAKIDAVHTGLDAKIDATRRYLSDQIVGLRRAVIDYHTSTIGHGVLISELEARLRRVETHLGLEPAGAH
jgi:predicted benzoate:H+ symporter BenE